MKAKNGFTLVEVLAVISVVGVLVIIFVGPNVMRYFNIAKDELREEDKRDFIEAAKTYAVTLKEGGSHVSLDENKTKVVTRATYNVGGNEIFGYEFTSYAAINGMDVTAEYLVNNEYYNPECKYDNDNENCKVNKNCNVHITFESTTVKANPSCNLDNDDDPGTSCKIYHQLGNMSASITNENECLIN